MVRERTAEESRDNVHYTVGHVTLQWNILVRRHRDDFRHISQEASLKQRPHVIGGVDLFHFHLRVDVAMVEEVYVRFFHLQRSKCYESNS